MKTLPHHIHTKPQTNLLSTASLVTVLSIVERGLGFLYRIVLSRLIGAEGLGLYQVSLSLFAVFLTIGTGGIPVTVSRFISKAHAENSPPKKSAAVGAGVALSLLLTLPVLFILLPFAQNFPFLFSDSRAVSVFKILLLGLCFSSVYAVIRGAFWGNKNFFTPSLLELAEETVMVIAGVLLLQNVPSAQVGAQKAAWAVVISYAFSFTASLIAYFLSGGKISKPQKQLKPLFNATLPITSVRASSTLVNSAISVLLPVMLIRSGISESQSLRLLGIVSGMAMPVLFIPSTIIGSLSLVLVPELSEDFYKKNFKRLYENITRGIYVAFLIATFLSPFFFVLGEDLGALAFSEPLAGEYIKKGCLLLLPLSLTMLTTGILNSLGFERHTFLFYFVGASGMLLCILLLPKYFGAFSYVFGLFISYVLTALCNFILLIKKCPNLFSKYFKPTLKKALICVFLLFPLSFLGMLFKILYSQIFGNVFTAITTGMSMLILSFIAYFSLRLLPQNFLRFRKKTDKKPR